MSHRKPDMIMLLFMVLSGVAMGTAIHPAFADITVSIADGLMPGCEDTKECYMPGSAVISPGDSVVWINDDSGIHTVVSGNPEDGPDGTFDSGLLDVGDTFTHTYSEEGVFEYYCNVHPWMGGMVIVDDDLTDTIDNDDSGSFHYYYDSNPDPENSPSPKEWMEDNEFLEQQTEWLNDTFDIPYDVWIIAKECGAENASYSPIYKTVTICYELIDHFNELYSTNSPDGTDPDRFRYDNTYQALYHEIGRAVLEIHNIPYTGLEEDVADQFSSLVLVRTDGGQEMLYNIAHYYQYSESSEDVQYWNTHTWDMQRLHNVACWVYGADPQYNQALIDDNVLPEERATLCKSEYGQIKYAFEYLLGPHTNDFFD